MIGITVDELIIQLQNLSEQGYGKDEVLMQAGSEIRSVKQASSDFGHIWIGGNN